MVVWRKCSAVRCWNRGPCHHVVVIMTRLPLRLLGLLLLALAIAVPGCQALFPPTETVNPVPTFEHGRE
jgi:hypothetical protein